MIENLILLGVRFLSVIIYSLKYYLDGGGEGGKVEGSRVELVKNKLILC